MEGGFDGDAVVAQEAWRGSVEDGGRGAGVAVGGVEDEFQDGADSAGGELLLVFVDAVGGGALAVGAVEDAGDGGVADEVGLAGGEAAGVADLDVLQISGRRVR